jgi:hypothetical protein
VYVQLHALAKLPSLSLPQAILAGLTVAKQARGCVERNCSCVSAGSVAALRTLVCDPVQHLHLLGLCSVGLLLVTVAWEISVYCLK